jgi:hypothetical protein
VGPNNLVEEETYDEKDTKALAIIVMAISYIKGKHDQRPSNNPNEMCKESKAKQQAIEVSKMCKMSKVVLVEIWVPWKVVPMCL